MTPLARGSLLLLRFVFWASPRPAAGMHQRGVLPAADNGEPGLYAQYLGKFCFDWDPSGQAVGKVSLSVTSEQWAEDRDVGLMFLLWSDEQHRWQKIRYNWPDTCSSLKDTAASIARLPSAESLQIDPQPQRFYNESVFRNIIQKLRPRWWYFAIVACNVTTLPQLTYHLHA